MNDILAHIAGAAGIAILATLFVRPYTASAKRRTKQKMDRIGDAIEKETIAAFAQMHENVAIARAGASAATGMAEIYAAMSEIEAQSASRGNGSGETKVTSSDGDADHSAAAFSTGSGSSIDQYSAYWHERTENPGMLKF